MLTSINYFTYRFLEKFAEPVITEDSMFVQDLSNLKGTFAEYALDILYIQMFVQVGVIFSNWFWLFYLIIPGYAVYKLGGYLLMYLGARQDTPEQEREYTAEEIKRMEKKQRKYDLQEKRMARFK